MLEMDAELEQYILAHSEPEGEVLAELSRATHLNVLRPRMLSGNLQGQFLKMICRVIGARRAGHTRGMLLFRWLPDWKKGECYTRST